MIVKTENCLYCGQKMESKTAKKKFCCDIHRVYWNREKNVKPEIIGEQKVFISKNQPVLDKYGRILVSQKKIKKNGKDIDELKKQFPIEEYPRLEGESLIDYKIRMSELNEKKQS